MDRRDFLKLSSLAGLSIAVPYVGGAFAADESSIPGVNKLDVKGLFVFVGAYGGWDPTVLMDPKPDLSNFFVEGDILSSGQIDYAPIPGAQEFFEAHFQKTMVLNGVDMETNSHDAGQRHFNSGRLGEGYPSGAALIAGATDPTLALSYLSYGGYDKTYGLVAPNRGLNSTELRELAYPHRMDPNNDQSAHYHSPTTENIIAMAREARNEARFKRDNLPRLLNTRSAMITAQSGADELRLLEEVLPEPAQDNITRQAQMITAAYKAGLCISASMSFGGFDTHSQHDANQIPRLTALLAGVMSLWNEAELQGIADEMTVFVGSDFGRTPQYNADMGKDHWSTTSMMLMGNGVPGNKVVGSSDDGHYSRYVKPNFNNTDDPTMGIKLKPGHAHKALRTIACVDGTAADDAFRIDVEELNLLDA